MTRYWTLFWARRIFLLIFGMLFLAFAVRPGEAATQLAIKLNAASVDGNNSGTARLGMHVSMTATVAGTANAPMTWTLQGAGTLTSAGLYAAPEEMPANPTVVITGTSVATPSSSVSYTFTLVNAVPNIVGLSPAAVAGGGVTSQIGVYGTGFTPGSVVMVNGTAVPTTFVSYVQVNAKAVVNSTTATPLAITVFNPAPVGGTSNSFSMPVTAPALKLNAASVDGNNSGTARMGMHVSMTATLSGTATTAINWTLQGAGTLSAAGLYTTPTEMPASSAVTITGTTTTSPIVSASYTFTIINAVPNIVGLSPAAALTGTTPFKFGVYGTGFVPGSVVHINGSAVATTFVSNVQVNAQATLSASTTGPLAITVVNPAPGGGTSTGFAMQIANSSLKLNAAGSDGNNSGLARLGMHLTLTATLAGTPTTAINWTLQGGGSISSAGLYSAPVTMPANSSVTITGTTTSSPTLSATYTFTLINPTPAIEGFQPAVLTSTSNKLEVWGTVLVPGTTILVNGSPVVTTSVSSNEVSAIVPATAGQTTPLSVTLMNPAPGGGTSSAISVPVAVPGGVLVSPATLGTGTTTITITGANFSSASIVYVNGEAVPTTFVSATKLTATAFVAPWRTAAVPIGVGDSTAPASTVSVPVVNTTAVTYDAAARFTTQAAFGPRPDIVQHIQQVGFTTFLNEQFAQPVSVYPTPTSTTPVDQPKIQFTLNALTGNNLLRQRVAFAFEEFITAAMTNNAAWQTGVPWQLMLENDAFGNFRDLMTDVTLSPTMGSWLNLGNNWAPTTPGVHPNQNYARELMQLFTMGPVQLNDDGSVVMSSSGTPASTYDDATVIDLSRALTGWGLPPANGSTDSTWWGVNYGTPMIANDSKHDHGAKTLFGTINIPAGQTIQEDLKSALDAVFNQPNVPPFVSKILIQHLVKSNPSPAYIERISHVFENDGTGVRGNLKAVVQAILLDPEARAGDGGSVQAGDGHLQEPILYFLSVMSALQTAPGNTGLVYAERGLAESIWQPDSVFSFYSPSFMIPATKVNAPEFQIFDGNYAMQRSQILYNILRGSQSGFTNGYRTSSWMMQNFVSIPDLLDAVNHTFYHGTMPAGTISAIETFCATLPNAYTQQLEALYLALNSDTFQVSY
jgi:uncharacterized protein (DUF1800 family)